MGEWVLRLPLRKSSFARRFSLLAASLFVLGGCASQVGSNPASEEPFDGPFPSAKLNLVRKNENQFCRHTADETIVCEEVSFCERADGIALPVGASYFDGRDVLLCDATGQFHAVTQLGCGLSASQVARMHSLFAEVSPSLNNSLSSSTAPPLAVYDAQEITSNMAVMARYCNETTMLEKLASYYELAYPRLSLNDAGEKVWLDPETNDENQLSSIQFSYIVSYTLASIAYLPERSRSTSLKRFQQLYDDYMTETYTRWLLGRPSMWIWFDCGVRYGVPIENRNRAYTFVDYVYRKLNKTMRTRADAPRYCDAVTEIELWLASGVTEYLGARKLSSRPRALTQKQLDVFVGFVRLTYELFESRVTPTDSGGLVFDVDTWFGATDYGGTGWDISHARRIVSVLETGLFHQDIVRMKTAPPTLIRGFAKQLSTVAYDAASLVFRLTNFPTGINTPFRSFGPFELTASYYRSGYAFWSRFDTRIGSMNQRIVSRLEAGELLYNTEDEGDSNESRLFRARLNEMAFLGSLSRPVEL